jgi:hypothetical protein
MTDAHQTTEHETITTITAQVTTITPAHTQTETLKIIEYFPAHEPRKGDPHYPLFNAARKRLKAAGKLVCWRCGTTENIQLHHAICEFALANGVDITKFQHLYPDLLTECTDEAFAAFVEGEGNLTPLCQPCHTGAEGIHCLPYPMWLPGRFWQAGQPTPARKE